MWIVERRLSKTALQQSEASLSLGSLRVVISQALVGAGAVEVGNGFNVRSLPALTLSAIDQI
jgi:hypothetical protein